MAAQVAYQRAEMYPTIREVWSIIVVNNVKFIGIVKNEVNNKSNKFNIQLELAWQKKNNAVFRMIIKKEVM